MITYMTVSHTHAHTHTHDKHIISFYRIQNNNVCVDTFMCLYTCKTEIHI